MNPKNFKVSVPTTTELTIKQAALLPYASFKPAPSGLSIFGMPEPYPALSKWMTETRNSVMEIRFPPAIRRKWGWKAKNDRQKKEDSYDWMDYLHLQPDDRAKLLSNPQNSILVYFVAGKNTRALLGQPSGSEMFVIDEVIYRKMTHRSILLKEEWLAKERKKPLRSLKHPLAKDRNRPTTAELRSLEKPIFYKDIKNRRLSFFLMKASKANQEPMRSKLLGGLSEHLFKEEKKA